MEEIDSSLELNSPNEKALGLIPILHSLQPNQKEVDIVLGGVSQTRQIAIQSTTVPPATAASTNISLNFNYDFSNEVSIDACVLLQMQVSVYIRGADNDRFLDLVPSKIALAQNAMARCMKSLNVRLNNNQVQVNPHIWVNAINKYWDNFDYRSYVSNAQPDPVNSFAAFSGAKFTGGNSPFNSPEQDDVSRSRGSYLPEVTVLEVASGSVQELKLTWTLTEPLFHPFFVRPDNQTTALHRIKNMSVDINFNDLRALFTDLTPKFSSANRQTVGDGVIYKNDGTDTVSALANTDWISVTSPRLLVQTYNPVVEIPREVTMPYHDMQIRQFPFSLAVTDAQPYQVSTGSINLNQVPEKIYLFCRQQQDINAPQIADRFCAIDRLVFRTNADAGGLASADTYQLFQMCKRNGLKQQTFTEFTNLQGSVICLDFSKGDVAGYIPGMIGNFTFDITAYVRNTCYPVVGVAHNNAKGPSKGAPFRGSLADTAADPGTWNFTLIAIQSGSMIADGNALRIVLGIDQQTAQEMAQSKFGAIYDYHRAVSPEGLGSGFFSSVRDHLRTAGRFLTSNNQIRNVAKQIAKDAILPLAQKYALAAQQSKDPRAATIGMAAAPALSMLSQQLGGKAEGSGIRLMG